MIEGGLINCNIAKSVWFVINDKLRHGFLDVIEVNKLNILYKIGVGKPQSHLISEVNWALWTNRCSNVYEGTLNSHKSVLAKLYYRLKLYSKIDKIILSVRAYNDRWLGINQAVDVLQ